MIRKTAWLGCAALQVAAALAGCSAAEPVGRAPGAPAERGLVEAGAPTGGQTAPAVQAAPADGQAGRRSSESAAGAVMVEVQGAVNAPGVYRLPADARLLNALEKAGGVTAHADTSDLNIAARLIDGSVLTVPYRSTPSKPAPSAAALNTPHYTRSGWNGGSVVTSGSIVGSTAPAPAVRVDLNSASQADLEELPGVGPKTAVEILQFRELQPFESVDDLRLIPGIGEKRVETLRPMVTVD